MTTETTTGMHLIRLLRAHGVDTVFGIPGVHTIELYRGLAGSGIRHVTPRHEQAAGFMADGYARVSGRPGVCLVISGPGMTNILTAMAQAYAESVPMLVISTVNAHGRMGSGAGWLHELPDQQGLAARVAGFSRTIHTPQALAPALAEAFALFASARPRPVHLELPQNVMLAPAPLGEPRAPDPGRPPAPDPGALARAAALLAAARAPLILAGGGAARAAALPALARALDAPVVMTANARGLMPPGDPLGVSLSPSLPGTRALVAEADVVLAIGTELGPTDYDMYEDGGFALPGTLIRADLDPAQAQRGQPPRLTLIGDAGATAAALLAALPPPSGTPDPGAPRAARANAGRAGLDGAMQADLALLDHLRAALPETPMLGCSTQAVYAGNLGFAAAAPGLWANSATGFGTLGWGLPAAIGASLATGAPVLALSGDGGLQFSLAELSSAVEAGARVILMLYDNQGYGEIKSSMIARNVPPLGVDILTPDLPAIARACGWATTQADSPADLSAALDAARAHPGCTMIRYTDRLRAAFHPLAP